MIARRVLRVPALAMALALSWAPAALACSVCVGSQSPDTRNAWIAMTAFMTFTPLSIVLAVAFWLRHRFKALEASEQAEALRVAPGREAERVGAPSA